jgi:hypothetical protein
VRDVVKAAIEGTRQVQRQHRDPDAEWEPFLIAVRPDGRGAVVPIMAATEREAWQQIAAACQVLDAQEAVMTMAAWTLITTPEEEMGREHRIKDDPAHSESILITYVGKGQDSELHVAPVYRLNGQPPTLGDYRMVATGDEVTGALARAMRIGLGE